MNRRFLVAIGLALFLAGSVFANSASFNTDGEIERSKVTFEQAREIALKKVVGTIEDEFPYEEEGKIIAFVFFIRDAKKKLMEVQIEPATGKIISVAEDK